MINKCYLHIDDYPRHASDIPFTIIIDWGDGSELEQYQNLYVLKIPGFYHIYADLEPREITVIIINECGQATKKILHTPFMPPECECRNEYNFDTDAVQVSFSDKEHDLTVTGCFTDIEFHEDSVTARLVTDVSTILPLVTFKPQLEDTSTFRLADAIPTPDTLTENLYGHVGNMFAPGINDGGSGGGFGDDDDYAPDTPTIVNEMIVDFIYSFAPTHVAKITLTGDEAFYERVGLPIVARAGSTPHEASDIHFTSEWTLNDDDLYEITVTVNSIIDTVRLKLTAGKVAEYDSIKIYTDDAMLMTSTQRVEVETRSVLSFTPAGDIRLLGGVPAELLYQSDESKKIHRVEIFCDTNARARLLNDEFEWTSDNSGGTYWRGIYILSKPEFMREWMFSFADSKDGTLVDDAVIHSVHFYQEISETEYDSPIVVKLGIASIQNEQEGIFYYTEENGRHHCVAVNELVFTLSDYAQLKNIKDIQTHIRLDVIIPPIETDYGTIEVVIDSKVNVECLPDSFGELDENKDEDVEE